MYRNATIQDAAQGLQVCEALSGSRCYYISAKPGPRAAGIRLFYNENTIIEDNYFHDNTGAIHFKQMGAVHFV